MIIVIVQNLQYFLSFYGGFTAMKKVSYSAYVVCASTDLIDIPNHAGQGASGQDAIFYQDQSRLNSPETWSRLGESTLGLEAYHLGSGSDMLATDGLNYRIYLRL